MRQLTIFCLIVCLSQTSSFAQNSPLPKVSFDVPAVVSCRDVTTEDFARTHSLEKLLEVRIKASSLIESGSDRLIRELFFFIYSPEQSIRIVDFSPSTTLLTEYAAPIDVSHNQEHANTIGLTFSPQLEIAGKANLNANLSDRKGETQKISKLPPKQLVVASGTQRRETAAYFKFKPSSQGTLEGTQELLLTVRVPNSWRADILHMHCRATTQVQNATRVSRSDFVVPVHIESDAPAKIKCDQLIRAELKLRKTAIEWETQKNEPQPKSIKHFSNQLTVFVKKEILRQKKAQQPKVSQHWLGQVIFGQPTEQLISKRSQNLNDETKAAIKQYISTRQQVVALNR